ncbi:MAG: hypothetical protein FWC41_05295 [Firmicutes bacterium]|nr:hypothetical protein [Bacillota bacterium]
MKLADRIAQSNYSEFTLQEFDNLKNLTPKEIFDILNNFFNYNEKSYAVKSMQILEYVAENSKHFAKDIAKKYADASNKYEMSDKQKWCVAYEFLKIMPL